MTSSSPTAAPTPELSVAMQRAAVLTGLAQHTLRWYERVGLVPDVQRSSTGRRRYSRHNLEWIEIVRALRVTGMSVAALKELTQRHHDGDAVRALRIMHLHRAQLLALLAHVYRSLHALDHVERRLRTTRAPEREAC